MFFLKALTLGASLLLARAQSSSSASASATASASASGTSSHASDNATGHNIITTTITSVIPSASNHAASTTLIPLTLTLNSSSSNEVNHTLSNGTVIAANGTVLSNGTNANVTAWHDGDQWIPFHIVIDPAYGILGAVLILSGIPVAILGGKNRWSSIAIVSGYSLMLFTLVMILRFGVQPNLQPPSPSPPTTTMRGLYLLAALISSFIGAGLGVFLYNFAKYCVSAAGGFTFAWFLLGTKSGGLIDTVLGRWGLLGGLTVAGLIASLPPKLTDVMMLVSTAFIGATTFTLGVDCYTRAGLKEFYTYNLGFHSLFPRLEGGKYPLTQTMQIELGILAAIFLIGAAIQTKVLNMLQKRLRRIREDEEMRIEAEEVSKAAERFKNVGNEMAEWEEKHGKGAKPRSLNVEDTPKSDTKLLSMPYHSVPLDSPSLVQSGTPSTAAWHSVEELHADPPTRADDELESKLKLLEDVRKARESIRGSLDELNGATPTPSLGGMTPRMGSPNLSLADEAARSRRHSSASAQVLTAPRARHGSITSMLDRPRGSSFYDTQPAKVEPETRERKASVASMLDRPRGTSVFEVSDSKVAPALHERQTSSHSVFDRPRGASTYELESSQVAPTKSSDWDKYVSTRSISRPASRPVSTATLLSPTMSTYGERSGNTEKPSSGSLRAPFPTSVPTSPTQRTKMDRIAMPPPSMPLRRSASAQPTLEPQETLADPSPWGAGHITGSAANSLSLPSKRSSQMSIPRTMTYSQLDERHRKRLSQLQNPVNFKLSQEAEAKEARERQQREKEQQRAREARQAQRSRQPAGQVESAHKKEQGRQQPGGAR